MHRTNLFPPADNDSTITDPKTGYPLSPLVRESNTKFPFPSSPCGVLPFYVNDQYEVVYGCMETNRCVITSTQPAAGTQDLIATNDGLQTQVSIEISKPLKDFNIACLKPYVGKNVSGDDYQAIVGALEEAGYKVYLEGLLATSVKETKEENGIDLRKNAGENKTGENQNLLVNMYEFKTQAVLAKRGDTTQKLYAAHLSGIDKNVKNANQDKIEEKIPFTKFIKAENNKGVLQNARKFYEKGIWCTLKELKAGYETQKAAYQEGKVTPGEGEKLEERHKTLIDQEFRAWGSRIELIEKVEATLIVNPDFRQSVSEIKSDADAKKAISNSDIRLMNKDEFKAEQVAIHSYSPSGL